MKRIGLWLTIGMLALSLVYLLKPRPEGARPKPAVEPTRPVASAVRVNINTASAKELDSLPGIGPVTARRIVEYREKNGRFERPEDLIIIEGIGEKKYRALADLIRVR